MSDRTVETVGRLGDSRLQGVLLTVAGVLVLSLDSLLVRLIMADALTIAFWRGLLMALGFWAIHAASVQGWGLAALLRPTPAMLLAALLYAGSTACFVGAVKHAPVANVLLILAIIPLVAALLSWLTLRERVARATWMAMAAAIAGLALVVGGEGLTLEGGLAGHLLALAVTLFIGGYFTLLRSGRAGAPLPALSLAGLLSALGVLPLVSDFSMPAASIPYMAGLGLVVMPVSFALISLGPRSLPAAEVGLIMLLEAVFGGAWAWLVLDEPPTDGALTGGAVVVAALALRAVAMRRGV